mgnify:CR=1 FL=1
MGRYRAEVAGRMENGRGAPVRAVQEQSKMGFKMGPRWIKMSERGPQAIDREN